MKRGRKKKANKEKKRKKRKTAEIGKEGARTMGKEIFWDQNLVPFRFFARGIWAPIRLKSGGNQGFPTLVSSRVLRELSVLCIHTFSDGTTVIDAWTDEKDINCSSLRKQPFRLALRRWERFARRNVRLNN